eukprot:scaffold7518_cov32-Attheya_sp.AAC.4
MPCFSWFKYWLADFSMDIDIDMEMDMSMDMSMDMPYYPDCGREDNFVIENSKDIGGVTTEGEMEECGLHCYNIRGNGKTWFCNEPASENPEAPEDTPCNDRCTSFCIHTSQG